MLDASAGETLTGDQIRALITDKTIQAEHLGKGFTFEVYFDPDGKTATRTHKGAKVTTAYSIDGDEHCLLWNGANRCATIMDNGDGTYSRINTSGRYRGKAVVKWIRFEDGNRL
jgi:hypothetical protein